jgi:hypothetical protein
VGTHELSRDRHLLGNEFRTTEAAADHLVVELGFQRLVLPFASSSCCWNTLVISAFTWSTAPASISFFWSILVIISRASSALVGSVMPANFARLASAAPSPHGEFCLTIQGGDFGHRCDRIERDFFAVIMDVHRHTVFNDHIAVSIKFEFHCFAPAFRPLMVGHPTRSPRRIRSAAGIKSCPEAACD